MSSTSASLLERPVAQPSQDASRERVLVLEDEPSVLRTIAACLQATGLEIVTCCEMEAAQALLARSRFDVVVTDLVVSPLGGLEGLRLVSEIANGLTGTRVIALSGLGGSERVIALGQSCGAEAVLAKPIDVVRLRRHVLGDARAVPNGARCAVEDVPSLQALLEAGVLRSVMQPIVSLLAGGPPHVAVGVECLARVRGHRALANPEVLFDYALRKGRVVETDLRCMRLAFAEALALARPVDIFVNAHPRTLADPTFPERVLELVREAGLSLGSFVFEMTEQDGTTDHDRLLASLERLRNLGFRLALDDYGDGFAGLLAVEALRPDYLKISGKLTRGIAADPMRQSMLASTVELADRLGIATILERIETEEELELARRLGVHYGQGWLFARPAPAEDLLASGLVSFPSR